MISRSQLTLLLLVLYFAFPINFFILGNDFGYGIQGFTYRYQVTNQGTSFIPISYELGYILTQTVSGKTVYSTIFWLLGTGLYTIGLIIFLLLCDSETKKSLKIPVIFMIFSGISFCCSCMTQYGLLFFGPSGISFLFGVPIIFLLTWKIFTIPLQMKLEN